MTLLGTKRTVITTTMPVSGELFQTVFQAADETPAAPSGSAARWRADDAAHRADHAWAEGWHRYILAEAIHIEH